MSTTDPVIEHLAWHGNTCTVGSTNFGASVNPDGLEAIQTIDPKAWCRPFFDHTEQVRSILHHNNMPSNALTTHEGFRRVYDELRALNPYSGPLYSYDIHCRLDSPLIAWFLVLGAKDERSSDARDRHEQIFNDPRRGF